MSRIKRPDPNEYMHLYSRPLYLTVTWLLGLLMGVFMLVQIYLNWENTILVWVGFIGGIFGLVAYLDIGIALVLLSVTVRLEADRIVGVGLYGQRKEILYSDITVMAEKNRVPYLSYPWLHLYDKKRPGFVMRLSGSLIDFGELAERLLEKADRCEHIAIKEMPTKRILWQKDPDYEIINRAKARAEENRKKMENTTA
jgi:hypothetical protein